MATILVTGATGFIGSHLIPALVERGHDVRAMTRHPDDYDGPGEPIAGDVGNPESLIDALDGVEIAYYLVHSLDSEDFEKKDAVGGVGVQRDGRCGGGAADRLPRRPRPRRRGTVAAPAVAPARWRVARRRRRAGDHAARGRGDRARRHLVGTHPPTRRPPAGDGGAPLGEHQYATHRVAGRDPISDGVLDVPETIGQTYDIGGPEVLRYADMMQRAARIIEAPVDPDADPSAAHPEALIGLVVAGHRRGRADRPQPGRLHDDRGGGPRRRRDPQADPGGADRVRRRRPAGAGRARAATEPDRARNAGRTGKPIACRYGP